MTELTDKQYISTETEVGWFDVWHSKAYENVRKWGLQDLATLAIATDEELYEVIDEFNDDASSDNAELRGALGYAHNSGEAVQRLHENAYEDDDGQPVDPQPSFDIDFEDVDLDALDAEIDDAAALLVQMKVAVKRARGEQ